MKIWYRIDGKNRERDRLRTDTGDAEVTDKYLRKY